LVFGVISSILFIAWLLSVVYLAVSTWCLSSFYARRSSGSPANESLPPVTILKPVRGADADTYDNLSSFVRQEYPEFQVIFGVAGPEDPSVPVIRRIISENPGVDMELVISGEPVGSNLKVSNLHYMMHKARHAILVVADADMRVDEAYLKAVASGFDGPDVGLVTCPYRGAYPEDTGAALEALTIDADFLPSVAVAEKLEGLSFALGATMAVRREALDAIGGFGALADYLADDYQLGNRVKKAGWRLVLSGYVVDSVGRREGLAGFFGHQLRWGRTYRVSRRGGYMMSGITKGAGIALLLLVTTGFSVLGWTVFLANAALRYAQAYFIEAVLVGGPGVRRWLWLLPFRDIAAFIIWAASLVGNRVGWKGSVFRIEKDGRMTRAV
jgi:ceramide glucosyltransferase